MHIILQGILFMLLISGSALAEWHTERRARTDVIVGIPAEAWSQNRQHESTCPRCCLFENRQYSEGAVIKTEGMLLQCVRDEKSVSTHHLIWRVIK
ncbi:DUF1496 domain-containing protein [Enterobacteriaceae bacterium LUAb1]